MSGCVYVAHALTTSYYKIGMTTNIEKRLHGLQGTIPFFDIEVVATHYHEKYGNMERLLHRIYADKKLRTSEWFDLTNDDLSTLLMSTIDLANRLGLNNNKVDLHDLFPSQQENAARLDEIEIAKNPDNQVSPNREREGMPKGPTDGALFCFSRYTAVEKLSAEMAREIESALGKEEYDPKWSQALIDYADALDIYTGEDTFSVILK